MWVIYHCVRYVRHFPFSITEECFRVVLGGPFSPGLFDVSHLIQMCVCSLPWLSKRRRQGKPATSFNHSQLLYVAVCSQKATSLGYTVFSRYPACFLHEQGVQVPKLV